MRAVGNHRGARTISLALVAGLVAFEAVLALGAGAVGVEFASLYRSAGAEVNLVEMLPSLVPLEDADIGVELRRQFEARGITCLTGHRLDLESVERRQALTTPWANRRSTAYDPIHADRRGSREPGRA